MLSFSHFPTAILAALVLILPLPVQGQTPASITNAGESAAPGIVVRSGQKFAFLGASITEFGWTQPGGYTKLVFENLKTNGVEIVPIQAGRSGNTSRDMLQRIDHDVIQAKAEWVTIDAGGNDIWHKSVDFAEYMRNMTALVDKAQAAGIHVIIQTCTPIGEDPNNEFNPRMAYYNGFLCYLAEQKQCLLCNLNADFQRLLKAKPSPDNYLTTDGVHMNLLGNRVMARGLLKTLGLTESQIAKTIPATPETTR